MFIATKNANIHLPGGRLLKFTKGEQVSPGTIKKAELAAPGSTKRYTVELSDNFIQRQLRW